MTNILINAVTFKEAVKALKVVVPKKPFLDILSLVRVRVVDGICTMAATDLKSSLVFEVGVVDCEDVEFLITLEALEQSVDAGDVEINAVGSITTDTSILSFVPGQADDFPPIPDPTEYSIALNANAFIKALTAVKPGMAVDDSRPILYGTYAEIKQDTIELATTDGFTLYTTSINTHLNAGEDVAFVINGDSVRKALKVLKVNKKQPDNNVIMHYDENFVTFRAGQVTFTAHLLDGRFPDFRSLIPAKSDTFYTVDIKKTLPAVRSMLYHVASNANSLKLTKANDITLKLMGHNERGNEKTSTVGALSNVPIDDISLNAVYLKQALESFKMLDSNIVDIQVNGESPILLTSVSSNLKIVIMPILNRK